MYTRDEHRRLMSYLNKESAKRKLLNLDKNAPFVIQPTMKESAAKDGKPKIKKSKKRLANR